MFAYLLIIRLAFSPDAACACLDPSSPAAGPTMRIEPAAIEVQVSTSFTVHVVLDGAADLGAFQFDLVYDPAVVNVTRVELEPFLGSTGRTAQSIGSTVDNAAGIASFGAFSFGSQAGPEGTGVLASVTATAVGSGTSVLALQNVVITDAMAGVQTASVEDGAVTVPAPAPAGTPAATSPSSATPTPRPTPPSQVTATQPVEPTATAAPGGPATATATEEAMGTPAEPPIVTRTPTQAGTRVSTPVETPGPGSTATSVPSRTPDSALSPSPTLTRSSSDRPGASPTPVEPPSASPVKSISMRVLTGAIFCLSIGGIALIVVGFVLFVLRRRSQG